MDKLRQEIAWLLSGWHWPPLDLAATLRLWQRRRKTRLTLSYLDAAQLRDVGLHPDSARREAEKPFWQG